MMKKVKLTKQQALLFNMYDDKLNLLKDINDVKEETVFDDMEWDDIISAIFNGYVVDGKVYYGELPTVFNFKSTINSHDLVYRAYKTNDNFYVTWETPTGELDSDTFEAYVFLKYVNNNEFVLI